MSHLNLRSMINKHDLLKIQMKTMGIDLLTFSESWLNENVENNLIHINDYNVVRNDRNWRDTNTSSPKRGGGVGAYIHNSLNFSCDKLSHMNISKKYMESIWFEINREKAKNLVIGVIYRPPNGDVTTFCELLTEQVNSVIEARNVDLYILGDFNINYTNKKDPDVKKLLNFQEMTTLKQLIVDNTGLNSCLDLIFTNSDSIYQSGVLDLNISDHDMVYVTHKIKQTKHSRTSFNHLLAAPELTREQNAIFRVKHENYT